MPDGWDESATAWMAHVGEDGDYARKHVLDPAMLARVRGRGFRTALDVGCGEGRFCRLLSPLGIRTVGVDPTPAFIERARTLDPAGDYRLGTAETLEPGAFDLVVSYLTLIDIDDVATAIAAMAAALRPGGTLLIANLTSFMTAAMSDGWQRDAAGVERFVMDRYSDERAEWVAWKGIRIKNWHRPLATYLSLLIENGFELRFFAEPSPIGGDPMTAERYRRAPWFLVMEWQKRA